jgi:predicted nicotinamide N-methyase
MKIEKTYHLLQHCQMSSIPPLIITERLDSSDYPIFTWSSALLLSAFIAAHRDNFINKRVLELGAGTGLPSIVCLHIPVSRMIATDRAQEVELLSVLQDNLDRNVPKDTSLQPNITVIGLDWQATTTILRQLEKILPQIDIILGADILYCEDDYEDLFQLLFILFTHNPQAIFYTSYQHRK